MNAFDRQVVRQTEWRPRTARCGGRTGVHCKLFYGGRRFAADQPTVSWSVYSSLCSAAGGRCSRQISHGSKNSVAAPSVVAATARSSALLLVKTSCSATVNRFGYQLIPGQNIVSHRAHPLLGLMGVVKDCAACCGGQPMPCTNYVDLRSGRSSSCLLACCLRQGSA